jgi:DNA-binding IclR family transcriptional regulator
MKVPDAIQEKKVTAGERKAGRARGVDRIVDILELVHTLAQAGMLDVSPTTGEVFFGLSMHFYGAAFVNQNPVISVGIEEVTRLGRATGETTELCTLIGSRYAIIHSVPGNSLIRLKTAAGYKLPIPWTASGRLLVAHMSFDEVMALIPPEDFALPNGTTLSPEQFYEEVRSADAEGICVTSGILDNFTKCVAVPIRSVGGRNVATMCFVLPQGLEKVREDELISTLRESQRRLSQYPAAFG